MTKHQGLTSANEWSCHRANFFNKNASFDVTTKSFRRDFCSALRMVSYAVESIVFVRNFFHISLNMCTQITKICATFYHQHFFFSAYKSLEQKKNLLDDLIFSFCPLEWFFDWQHSAYIWDH